MILLPIVLIGFMGAGKTSIGALLAEHYGYEFVDIDACIVDQCSMSISDVFAKHGESYFRDVEGSVFASVLGQNASMVIATGGGVVDQVKNQQLLQQQPWVVWLDVSFDTVLLRVGGDVARPLMDRDVRDRYDRRQALYRDCSTFRVDCNQKSVESVAELIINRYG